MEDVWNMLQEPKTLDEAKAMIAAAMRCAVGGHDAMDVIIRHRVKGVPIRQIAREDGCDREKVTRRVERFTEVCAAMESARQRVPVLQ